MRVSIKPEDVGKRVTLQFFNTDGSAEEAVGTFEKATVVDGEPVLHVRKRDDTLVQVPMNRIRAGKVVRPPRR